MANLRKEARGRECLGVEFYSNYVYQLESVILHYVIVILRRGIL